MILTRIAWCLEQASEDNEIENEYKEEYNNQLWSNYESFKDMFEVIETDENNKPKLYALKENEVDEKLKENYWNRAKEINEYKKQCKDEAFDLIKKYFYNLWD